MFQLCFIFNEYCIVCILCAHMCIWTRNRKIFCAKYEEKEEEEEAAESNNRNKSPSNSSAIDAESRRSMHVLVACVQHWFLLIVLWECGMISIIHINVSFIINYWVKYGNIAIISLWICVSVCVCVFLYVIQYKEIEWNK